MTVTRTAGRCALAVALLSPASLVHADDGPKETKLTAGFNGAPFIRSSDDTFYMEFGGRVHLDFRGYSAEFAPASTFLMRRARLKVESTVYGIFEFKVQADFADDEATLLRDGFVNVHAKDAVQIMVGQFKAPFSQEEWQSSKYMGFVERSMINNLVPGRSPGVMVHGHTVDKVVQYAGSVQNDESELGLNRFGGLDVFGQLRFEPWRTGLAQTFSFGGAVGVGNRDEERFVLGRTTSRSIVFFDKVPLKGRLVRRNVEGWWYPGPVLVQAEYDDLRGERNGLGDDGADLPDVRVKAFMAQALYVLTGETNDPDEPITPARPFHDGGPGAWEIGGRVQVLDIEGANRVTGLSFGVNWWFNEFIRYQANVGIELFRDPPDPTTGDTSNVAFLTRLNMFF